MVFGFFRQVSLLGGADESVKMSTSPTLLLDTRSAVHSTAIQEVTTAVPEAMTATPEAVATGTPGIGWSGADDGDTAVAAVAGQEDVTAELSAPVAVAAGLGHAEWQLLAAAGASVAVFLLLALVLAYRRTGAGSPALHKVVRHDDAECPPLLDYAPRPMDFAKYLGKSAKKLHIFFFLLCLNCTNPIAPMRIHVQGLKLLGIFIRLKRKIFISFF